MYEVPKLHSVLEVAGCGFNCTIRADSFHHAISLFNGESFRMWNGGGINALYAEGLSAGCAGKMDMRGMGASAFASAVDL